MERTGLNSLGREPVEQGLQGGCLAGEDDVFRAVQRGDGKAAGELVREGVLQGRLNAFQRRKNGRHCAARGQGGHQAAAGGDQFQAICQAEDARQAGRHVFANAVPQDGVGFDAPRQPDLGQGIFEGEEGGLGELGLVKCGAGARRSAEARRGAVFASGGIKHGE